MGQIPGSSAYTNRLVVSLPPKPATSSLNASLAQWLIGSGHAPRSYVASQGTALGRADRVHVDQIGDDIWIGGNTRTNISGTVNF